MDIDQTIAWLERLAEDSPWVNQAQEFREAAQHLRRLRDALAGIVSASDKNEGMGYRPLNHVLLATARAALNEVAE